MVLKYRYWIALFVVFFAASGCRPSQQTRRGAAANQRNGQSGMRQDSLLMVQDKLLTIIDTMASVVAQDRARIRSLELEVAKLKSLIEQQHMGGVIPPPAPPVNVPMQNYNSPPSQENNYTAPQSNSNYSVPQANTSNQFEISPQSAPMLPLKQPVSYPPNEKYSAALKLFNDGRYMDALTSFDELSRVDASSQYAPNYLYWKGESLYALGQYEEAIRTFHDVLTKYSESAKADDAEFKIGASYEKLGDRRNARSAYERLILSYPQSEYKARAEARLNKLK